VLEFQLVHSRFRAGTDIGLTDHGFAAEPVLSLVRHVAPHLLFFGRYAAWVTVIIDEYVPSAVISVRIM
jgi:hypothetical protein